MATSPPRPRHRAPALLIVLALAGLLMTSASAQGADVTTIPRQRPSDDTVTIVSTTCRSFASVSCWA